jgi:simple sugar transport system substrate-binding protein
MQICLTKEYGFSGLHIDTGGALVTKDNIDQIASLVDQGIR